VTPSLLSQKQVLDQHSPFELLLIEDSTSDRELVLALLEDELPHAKITVAANLEQAMTHLDERRFDAALADLSLPDADGLAVVHAVRSRHPETALLVLTGRADGELALWALAEGAQDYLVKGQHDGARLATAVLHALQRQRAEQEAHRYLHLALGLLDALEAPTCAVDASSNIIAINAAWREFMTTDGGDRDKGGVGTGYMQACEQTATDDDDLVTALEVGRGLRGVLAGDLTRYEHEYAYHEPVDERWFSVRIAQAEIDGARGAVISHVDVTALHVIQETLAHQTLHDPLTGLPNRLLLLDRLGQSLADSVRRGSEVAVAFLDLDHFKRINDSLGHAAGDELLIQVAARLNMVLRTSDTLSRFSGDEFVVLWPDVGSADQARILSARLTHALEQPFDLADASVSISASVGLILGQPTQSAEEVVAFADAAMYDAKRHGGARVRMFSQELRQDVDEMLATESALRLALARSELVLHYQPVIDLDTGRPTAVEALARWQHPERGLIPPFQFIPIAESSGLIGSLGKWALEQACHDAAAFSGAASGLDVAVNLSVRQLTQPDLVTSVQEALNHSGLAPHRLVLEVTESAVMEDTEAAAVALDALAALGVRIAVDDFGTGYSSLLYLRRYPITILKLDRAFVSGIDRSRDDEAICRSVVSLAHAVEATSIAEGVETIEQYGALRGFGCQQAQGFLWSPAVPLAELEDALLACRTVAIPAPRRKQRPASGEVESTVAARIATLHTSGASLHTIAAALNRAASRNPAGGRWTAHAVARHIAAA
jgi:diguanylate cyclase (GGDEF)-like protein